MFPTNGDCLIGISNSFLPFVYGYSSSCPRAQCTPNKSVPTLRYTFVLFLLNVLRCQKHIRDNGVTPAGRGLYIYTAPYRVGTYRVQSLGFPKLRQTVDNSFVLGPILLELFPFNSGMTLRSTVV